MTAILEAPGHVWSDRYVAYQFMRDDLGAQALAVDCILFQAHEVRSRQFLHVSSYKPYAILSKVKGCVGGGWFSKPLSI